MSRSVIEAEVRTISVTFLCHPLSLIRYMSVTLGHVITKFRKMAQKKLEN